MLIETPTVFEGKTFDEHVYVSGTPDVIFRGCTFLNGLRVNGGPSVAPSPGLVVDRCSLTSASSHAIHLNWNAPDALIVNNRITSPAGNGIWVGNGSDAAIITGNRVTAPGRMGIEVWNAEACHSGGNVITDTGNGGISCHMNHDGVVIGNILKDLDGWGIENAGSKVLTVTGNTVHRATQRPLSASQPGQVTVVVCNTFIDCGWGLQVYQGGSGTIIQSNHFNNVGSGKGANGRTIFINQSPDTLVEDNILINGKAHTAIFGAKGHNHIIGYPHG